MRAHKLNVERRMRMENYFGYHRCGDKMRRGPKQILSLDSTWYTDNIYSNQSIDLEEDYITCNRKIHDINGNNTEYDSNDIYIYRKKTKIVNTTQGGDYKYPKSNSCCFGMSSSYERKSKPSTIPKSHSFSTSRVNSNGMRKQQFIDMMG